MAYYSDMTLDARLSVAQQSINNALSNPTLAERIAHRSYTAEKVAVGKTLLTNALETHDRQIREYGESYNATDVYDRAWQIVVGEFKDLRGIARVIFKDDRQSYTYVGLPGAIKSRREEAETQIRTTYSNILASDMILSELQAYGYPASLIQEMLMRVEELTTLKSERASERTEAQQATRDRDEVVGQLDEWMSDFLTISRIAVKDQPELMELLGEVVPSAS